MNKNIKVIFKYDYKHNNKHKHIQNLNPILPEIKRQKPIKPVRNKKISKINKFLSKKTLNYIRTPFKLMYQMIFRRKNNDKIKLINKNRIIDDTKLIDDNKYDADDEKDTIYIVSDLIPEDEKDIHYITYLLILEYRYNAEKKAELKAEKKAELENIS